MSEKYTIEGEYPWCIYADYDWHAEINTHNFYCECNDKERAELICRLLNDDEKRKSLPKIDKNIKAELIKAFNIKSKHSEFEEINNKWKQIVKAIELLECE